MSTTATAPKPIRSTIPARLDRLRWSPFHTGMVLGLRTAWILDGLSITVAKALEEVAHPLTQVDSLAKPHPCSHAARGRYKNHSPRQHRFLRMASLGRSR